MEANAITGRREPWNKGKIVGQKAPFKLKDIWALRVRLQMANRVRELALFDLGIDSKLRGCDLVKLRVRDICHGDQVASRAIVMQQKTQRPVQFEITPPTCDAVQKWIKQAGLAIRRLPVSKPHPRIAPSRHPAVRQDPGGLGRGTRTRPIGLWNALDPPHQGDADLQAYEEPQGGAVVARAHQVGLSPASAYVLQRGRPQEAGADITGHRPTREIVQPMDGGP